MRGVVVTPKGVVFRHFGLKTTPIAWSYHNYPFLTVYACMKTYI